MALTTKLAVEMCTEMCKNMIQGFTARKSRGISKKSAPGAIMAERAAQQESHSQTNLYRAVSSITTFRAKDPDPKAVDDGTMLGVRIEVMRRGQFLRSYYVLLNRPYRNEASAESLTVEQSKWLRIHRHTVPPAVPIKSLEARYLPPLRSTQGGSDESDLRRQDLSKFARMLRRYVARYHNRLAGIADLRRATGLSERRPDAQKPDAQKSDENAQLFVDSLGKEHVGWSGLTDISTADVEARQIQLEWADGRRGRITLEHGGKITNHRVYKAEGGRDMQREKQLVGDANTLYDLVTRVSAMTDQPAEAEVRDQ
jgi:central kinetochore subunit Mal2/MCM21